MPRIAHLKNQQAVWEESGWHIEVPNDIPDDEVEDWALAQAVDKLTLDYTQNGQEVGLDSEWEVTEVIDLSGGMATDAPPSESEAPFTLREDGREWALTETAAQRLAELDIAYHCGSGEPNERTNECGHAILHLRVEAEFLSTEALDAIVRDAHEN